MRLRNLYVFWLAVSICLLHTALAGAQTTLFVDDDGDPNGDCTSWGTACSDLQDALAIAGDPNSPVTEIRVAEGTYTPADPNGDRTVSFQLLNGVALCGGYAGISDPNTDPNSRNIDLYETILSGDLNGNDGPDFTHNNENSYHVVTGSGTDETAILDGVTITAGSADKYTQARWGGGMYNNLGSPTLTNCTFSNNWALWHGGGMYNDESNPTLTNCTFSGNWAWYGGGMYNSSSNPTLADCTFSGNSADSGGGGMCNGHSSPTLTDCTFSGNSADSGGGMCNSYSSPTLTDCTFIGNSAHWGGGMHNYHSSSPMLTNCTFSDNSANYGGGMRNGSNCSSMLTNCTFSDNSANEEGGGIWNGSNCSPTLTNCTFAANSAYKGRALCCNSYDPQMPSSVQMTNCILWDGGDEVWNNDGSAIIMTYSCIQDCNSFCADPNAHNIGDDPLFVAGPLGDYYLSQVAAGQGANSPCVGAGSDTAANLGLDTLTTRTDEVPDSGIVDMGYHYPLRGDCDGDGDVDLEDFIAFQNCFTGPGGPLPPDCECADFDGDGDVDCEDWHVFSQVWTGGFPMPLLEQCYQMAPPEVVR